VSSGLYRGHLVHTRRDRHARRTFRYPLYVACIDLDELPALHRGLRLFSHNRPNLFALRDRDYEDGAAGLRGAFDRALAAHGVPPPAHARLVTQLRVAGYVFNPVSFFLGYDAAGALTAAVAEINNTYGGRHRYVLGPAERAGAAFRTEKDFFVSPFLHGPATYDWSFDAPLDGDALGITVDVRDADGARVLVAHLDGARTPLSDRALAAAAVRYPLMTVQVIGLIHWQALKLHRARVPYRRPGLDHRPLDPTPPGRSYSSLRR